MLNARFVERSLYTNETTTKAAEGNLSSPRTSEENTHTHTHPSEQTSQIERQQKQTNEREHINSEHEMKKKNLC